MKAVFFHGSLLCKGSNDLDASLNRFAKSSHFTSIDLFSIRDVLASSREVDFIF